jgi:FKBP-type peptidyl-prolyl cis-trans isomerase
MPRRTLLPVVAVVGALALAACGSSGSGSSAGTTPASTPASTPLPTGTTVVKPTVSLPASTPTSLVTTVVTPGSGPQAAAGDTVIVNYVGVRSADGTEFDNSYDKGSPIPVKLGAGSVIPGWDQGLVGAQAGERLQLDIPADLAYGDNPPAEPIKPGDALSFVIDVVAVVPATDPADEPQITVTGAANREDVVTDDLVVGTGPTLQKGQTAAIQIIAYRGDTGEQVYSTWQGGQPLAFAYQVDDVIPGLVSGMEGMNVGGRRQITIPFAQAFGESGNENLNLPGSTDVVLVVDLIAAY